MPWCILSHRAVLAAPCQGPGSPGLLLPQGQSSHPAAASHPAPAPTLPIGSASTPRPLASTTWHCSPCPMPPAPPEPDFPRPLSPSLPCLPATAIVASPTCAQTCGDCSLTPSRLGHLLDPPGPLSAGPVSSHCSPPQFSLGPDLRRSSRPLQDVGPNTHPSIAHLANVSRLSPWCQVRTP